MKKYPIYENIFNTPLNPHQIILYSILKSDMDKWWTVGELQEITLWSKQQISLCLAKMVNQGYAQKKKVINSINPDNPKIISAYNFYNIDEEEIKDFLNKKAKGVL